jgi:hypothetical protein
MYERAKQFTLSIPLLRRLVGVLILAVGLLALITPMTPGGIILTLVGLELVGLELVLTKKLKEKLLRAKKDTSAPTTL